MKDRENAGERREMGSTYRETASSQIEPASGHQTASAQPAASRDGDGQSLPFNYERSVARLGGDAMLFREIVGLFLEDAPALLVQAHRALAIDDATTLERAAHSLKGLAANLDALAVVAAAQSIEHHAQQHDLSLAGACLPELSKRLGALQSALTKFLAEANKT